MGGPASERSEGSAHVEVRNSGDYAGLAAGIPDWLPPLAAPGIAFLGFLVYAVSLGGYEAFFGAFHVSLDEVGLSQASIVGEAGGPSRILAHNRGHCGDLRLSSRWSARNAANVTPVQIPQSVALHAELSGGKKDRGSGLGAFSHPVHSESRA